MLGIYVYVYTCISCLAHLPEGVFLKKRGSNWKKQFSSMWPPLTNLSFLLFLCECICAYIRTFICTWICICTWLVVCARHICICVYMHIVPCALPRRGIFENPGVELEKTLFFKLTPKKNKLKFFVVFIGVYLCLHSHFHLHVHMYMHLISCMCLA